MDEIDKSKEEVLRDLNVSDIDILNNLLHRKIIDLICAFEKSVITSEMNPETSDSNIVLKSDQSLDDKDKTDKTIRSSKTHFGTINEKDGFSNFSSSDNCSNIEASGFFNNNFQADNNDCTSNEARKLILNIMVSDTDTCSSSQTSEPRSVRSTTSEKSNNNSQSSCSDEADTCSSSQISEPSSVHSTSSEESDNNSQSSSSDGAETSTSTIKCLDNGSEISESTTDADESSDCSSETSENIQTNSVQFLDNTPDIISSCCSFSDSDPGMTSTTMTKNSCRVQNWKGGDSKDCNSKTSINTVKPLYINTDLSVASLISSNTSPNAPSVEILTYCSEAANPTNENRDILHQLSLKVSNNKKSVLGDILSDSNSNPCDSVQFSDSDSESQYSTFNLSDRDRGSYQADLKFSDNDQEPLNSRQHDVMALWQEFRMLKDNNTALSAMDRDERIQFLTNESRYTLHNDKCSDNDQNGAINDDTLALVKHQEVNFSCKTIDAYLEKIVDVFKTIVKCHPIKKFDIPSYEYANTERTLGTTGGKLDNSSTTCAISVMQLYGNEEHRKIFGESFSNIDSHKIMVFEAEDCFSENSRIICDSLIKEYLNSASKLKFMMLKKIKDISNEDYELRMSNILHLDDELGFLSAKIITTINDWDKQVQEIKQNLQNDAQSKTRSRGLYHMGILRICLSLARILLVFNMGKQLKLEKYERCLMFYNKRNN